MSKATGEIIETPTGELPYKAVIKVDEKFVGEQFFDSRVRAEIFIVETLKGLEDVARKEGRLREFAASSNGDRWYLGRNDDTMHAYVVHKANLPSGGATTHIEIGAFLNRGPIAPEHQALLRLIGTLVDGNANASRP